MNAEDMNPWPGVKTFATSVFLNEDRIVIGPGSRIDSFCKLEGGLGITIGEFCHVASYVHLNIGGGWLNVGDHCFFASHSGVVTGGNKPEGRSMSAVSPDELQVRRPGQVIFKDFSGLCSYACVLPGVTLHEGAVAAAGAIVTHDIPAWEIWAGNPARFLRRRLVGEQVPAVGVAPVAMDEDWEQRDADLRATNRHSVHHR
jgi:acetyltransferase-like isoleucine patch superfamily enzyme